MNWLKDQIVLAKKLKSIHMGNLNIFDLLMQTRIVIYALDVCKKMNMQIYV